MMFQANKDQAAWDIYGVKDYETADGVREILALEDGMEAQAAEFLRQCNAA